MAFGVFSSPLKHCDVQIVGLYIVFLLHSIKHILETSTYYLLEIEKKSRSCNDGCQESVILQSMSKPNLLDLSPMIFKVSQEPLHLKLQ